MKPVNKAELDQLQVDARRRLWAIEREHGSGDRLRAAFEIMRLCNESLAKLVPGFETKARAD